MRITPRRKLQIGQESMLRLTCREDTLTGKTETNFLFLLHDGNKYTQFYSIQSKLNVFKEINEAEIVKYFYLKQNKLTLLWCEAQMLV